eukprot:COSAG02_NODE_9539_length_2186_cov_1.737422_5_plen_101_part_00
MQVSLAAAKRHDRSALRRLPLVPQPTNDVRKVSQGLLDREVGDLVLIKRVRSERPAAILPRRSVVPMLSEDNHGLKLRRNLSHPASILNELFDWSLVARV